MDLADVHGELVEELNYGLAQVIDATARSGIGDVFDTLSAHFEALGLCHLLEFADAHKLRVNLVRSGHARRYFLKCCRLEGNTTVRYLARSRNRSFLAALAGGSLAVSRDIATESIHPWNPAWEYEDDFAYFEFLHLLAKQPNPFPQAELEPILAQFERALEGGDSTRFDVVKALLARDGVAATKALDAFLEEEEARIDEARSSAAVHERDPLVWPNAAISLEALALLKAAELAQVPVTIEHQLVPAIARLPWSGQAIRDVFEQIEQGIP